MERGKAEADVVIPTYEGRDLLPACLEDLADQTLEHRVIVVDDGSTDGTAELVAARFPEAQVLALGANRGFAQAANAGIEAATAEAVVLLNNDVRPRPDFLERVVAPLADPGVGMVAALLLRPDGAVDSLGLEVDGTLAAFPRLWGADPAAAEARGTDGLLGPTGGAAAYRRAALADVGAFDERVFAYGEDVDLALRMRGAGWSCAVAPGAVGVHLGSASFGHRSPFQVYNLGWSRAYLMRKYGVLRDPGAWPAAVLGEAGSVGWQLLRARDASGLRGRIAGWRAARRSHAVPRGSVNPAIGLAEGVRRRRAYRGA